MHKDELLYKWLNETLSEAEMEAFTKREDFHLNARILKAAKQFKSSHFTDVDDFNAFKTRYNTHKKPVRKLNWITPLLRIASIFIIAFGTYVLFFYSSGTAVYTQANEKRSITLPDQSIVMLNADSRISYENDWADKRELLLEGEAYFEVAKGKQFDVMTSNGTVTVVGTAFNVKQRQAYFEVQCFEGIVKVSSDTIVRQLTAGQTYQILNGQFVQDEIAYTKPQWTNNRSLFKAIPFYEVVNELERQYNVEIQLKDVVKDRLFTGGFTHENLDNALISVTQPMNLTYEMNTSNQVVIHDNKK